MLELDLPTLLAVVATLSCKLVGDEWTHFSLSQVRCHFSAALEGSEKVKLSENELGITMQ